MATMLKLTFTRYVDAQGKRVKPGTAGARKVKEKSSKWYGQYRDADSKPQRVPLCTDKVAARQMLAELVRDIERGKVGLTDPFAEHRKEQIDTHVESYASHLRHKGVSAKHLTETIRRLKAVLGGCKVRMLTDLKAEPVERFLSLLADEGASARTRNTYRTSAKAFSKWCLKTRRLGEDALASLDSVTGPTKRQRRALTEIELNQLLKTAKERPLIEAMLIRRGERKGQAIANVRPEIRVELERLGRERSLIYKVLVFTGLRRGELAALEVRHLRLTGPRPEIKLPGSLTKNREEASLPIRADLVAELADWIRDTGRKGADHVFTVPVELVKILKRDLKLAGIDYRDENGRTLDVHSLRHTTATYLAKAKVSPRIAQKFMRHSDIKLTMQTYTDVNLLDESEALAALPQVLSSKDKRGTEI
jgi:integrase